MAATTLSEFRAELLASGSYRTSPEHRAAVRAKPGAWTTFRFSWSLLRPFRISGIYEALGRFSCQKWTEFCFSTVTCAEALGMNVILEGWENRRGYDGPVMYLCNHMSMTETVILPPIMLTFGPFSIVAKKALAHLPFLEKAAEHMHIVGIGRKSPREDLMTIFDEGCKRIAQGGSFLIFPQGSRERVFARKGYSSIGAKLAERAGCPVVPIVVDTRCQPTRRTGLLGKVFKDYGPVDTSRDIRVACGPVIPCAKSKALHEAAFEWMAAKLESWGLPVEYGEKSV